MQAILKNRPLLIGIVIIALIPIAAITYYLAEPLFVDDEVSEDLPSDIIFVMDGEVEVRNMPDDMTVEEAEQQMIDAAAAPDTESADPMPEDIMMSDDVDSDNAPADDQVTAVEVKRGQFRDADNFHQGSGDAILFELSDGRHLLRFENFRVTNGPDLHVYLVPQANASGRVSIDGYVDLGQLKGNVGDQNYFIDTDIAIPDEASIVIWCEPFGVLFSTATLTP